MRSFATAVCLSLLLIGSLGAQTPATTTAPPAPATVNADQLLQRGKDDYHAARYTEAVDELRAASAAFLTAEEKQQYVDTGTLATLPQVEQSLAYLALAYAKLGKNGEARDAIARLANAERIAPTLAALPLGADASELQAVIARVAPSVAFPQPGQQPVAVAQATPPPPPATAPAQPTTAPPPAQPVPTQTAQAAPAPCAQPQPAQVAADRAEIMRLVEEQVAVARSEIEKEAATKIAEVQKEADARVAAERAAAQKGAAEKIVAERAAIERDAQAKIDAERVAAQKKADEEIAAARAAAQRDAEQKIAAERAAAEETARAKADAAAAEQNRVAVTGIRHAESLAEGGNIAEANRAYNKIALAQDSPRDVIAAAAAGLYRTADYSDAANAFRRLGTFARGEEDLRYYYAVSLFETGRFQDAKHELECAMPFIAATPDVERYRAKIEGMP